MVSSIAEVAAALADRVPGVVKFGELDLADVNGWIAEARLPVFISQDSQCWKRGPVVFFDRALLPGADGRWVSRVSAFAARRLPPHAAETIARALAAQSQDMPEDKYPLEWSLEFWRTVYGATPEEAEAALAAALEERGQGEK